MTQRRSPCHEPLVFWWPWSSTDTIIGTNWHSCWQAEEEMKDLVQGGWAPLPWWLGPGWTPKKAMLKGPVLCVSGGDRLGVGGLLTPSSLQRAQEHEPSSHTFLTGTLSMEKQHSWHMDFYPCHTTYNSAWVWIVHQMVGEGIFPPLWTQGQVSFLSKGLLKMHWVPWWATSPQPLSALWRWRENFLKVIKDSNVSPVISCRPFSGLEHPPSEMDALGGVCAKQKVHLLNVLLWWTLSWPLPQLFGLSSYLVIRFCDFVHVSVISKKRLS